MTFRSTTAYVRNIIQSLRISMLIVGIVAALKTIIIKRLMTNKSKEQCKHEEWESVHGDEYYFYGKCKACKKDVNSEWMFEEKKYEPQISTTNH